MIEAIIDDKPAVSYIHCHQKVCSKMELTTRGSLVHSQALAMFAGTDSMGLRDDNRDQRLRPLPNNSECEPKRTNSIALLFLSNQIKSVSFSIWHSI